MFFIRYCVSSAILAYMGFIQRVEKNGQEKEMKSFKVTRRPLSDKIFFVRITKCSSPHSWYRNTIGHVYEVYHDKETDSQKYTLECDRLNRLSKRFINSFDCEKL